jgi:hypothetical protein
MVKPVQRFSRAIVFLLVFAQLLLAVPVVVAASPAECTSMADEGHPAHGDSCPCCPDGAQAMSDCFASCALLTALPPLALELPTPLPGDAVRLPLAHPRPASAEPPLKPPPISN